MGKHSRGAGHVNRFGIGLHLPLQLIDQLRKQFFLPCHLAAHFLHHGGNLRRIAAAELLGEHIADGIEVIGRYARGNANDGILVDSAVTVTIKAVVSVSGTSWMRFKLRICGAIITDV